MPAARLPGRRCSVEDRGKGCGGQLPPVGGRAVSGLGQCRPAPRNTIAQLRDRLGMKRNTLAALIAGMAALVAVLALALGPWLTVAIPSIVTGLVYRNLR
jgi:hypothetical protein